MGSCITISPKERICPIKTIIGKYQINQVQIKPLKPKPKPMEPIVPQENLRLNIVRAKQIKTVPFLQPLQQNKLYQNRLKMVIPNSVGEEISESIRSSQCGTGLSIVN